MKLIFKDKRSFRLNSKNLLTTELFSISTKKNINLFFRKKIKSMRIPLKNGNYVNLNLEKFDILTPDVKFIEKSGNGEKEQDLEKHYSFL